MTSSWQCFMGQTHDSNLVIAFQLLLSSSLTWNQAMIWDQVLYRSTRSHELSASQPAKRVIKTKLFEHTVPCPGSGLTPGTGNSENLSDNWLQNKSSYLARAQKNNVMQIIILGGGPSGFPPKPDCQTLQ